MSKQDALQNVLRSSTKLPYYPIGVYLRKYIQVCTEITFLHAYIQIYVQTYIHTYVPRYLYHL